MVNQLQEDYNTSIQENIRELIKEKYQLHNYSITLEDFLDSNNITALIVGTMIGFALTYIVKDISVDILGPIMHRFLFEKTDYIELFGTQFNIEHIISNLVFAILTVIVLYVFLIIFLRTTITTTALNKKNVDIDQQTTLLKTSMYQENSIKLMSQMNELLVKLNNKIGNMEI